MGREPYIILEDVCDDGMVHAIPQSILETHGMSNILDAGLGVLSERFRYAGTLALSSDDFSDRGVLHLDSVGDVADISLEDRRSVRAVLEDVVAEALKLNKSALRNDGQIVDVLLKYAPVSSTIYFLMDKDFLFKAFYTSLGGVLEIQNGKLYCDGFPASEDHLKNTSLNDRSISLAGSLSLLRRQYDFFVQLHVEGEDFLLNELKKCAEKTPLKHSQEEIDSLLDDAREVVRLEEETGELKNDSGERHE